jgi:hypothetical protein
MNEEWSMRPLLCMVALVLGGGCAGEAERAAPWREQGLLHDKPSWLSLNDKDNNLLKSSQPLPAEAGSAAAAESQPGPGAEQGLPSAKFWQ